MSEPDTDTDARRGRGSEIIFAVITILAALVFALVVIPNGVTRPASVKHLPLSPVFLPYVLTIGVGIFALIHLLEAIFAAHIPGEDDASLGTHPRWKSRVLMLVGLLALYLLMPGRLGMPLTAIIVTIALMAIGGERRPLILLGVGIAVPVLVYLFFAHVAQVPLPMGLFVDRM
ncbi:Tripartite tricarboxylate transporter TctB family protein [Roseovarius sp. THAF9]|uniref:tripartite tricarboxylate transporter TctB family protein n=1 Tax=Roseovarius sp. THAF9 TaxID=2587847 RepID=UPI001268C11D|nr:tripartite tricarboxylate transporter TctB family protein [Roseovarius sp. THAF9]QFT92122.1 Tripartite tricarboxylate transporter TctB family protein [Roseovarius sp. THAF9]